VALGPPLGEILDCQVLPTIYALLCDHPGMRERVRQWRLCDVTMLPICCRHEPELFGLFL
jgi:hypothetical protein